MTATLLVALSFFAEAQTVKVQFQNFAGNEPLRLDSGVYKNETGQSFTVSKFKYYIGNIHLKQVGGKEFISKEYFLVNEDEEDSKQIILSDIPADDYVGLSFIVGVDSLHNCNGIQSGALDPVKGMFWTWNTGYIFVKLEGHSPQSSSPGNIFEYHIGGYKQPSNCIRAVTLGLKSITIEKGKEQVVKIKADLLEMLRSPTVIDFSKLSSVTDFHNATVIADNYSDMFSIVEN